MPIILTLSMIPIPVLATETSKTTFTLSASEDIENNSIQLNWDALDNVQKYQIFQKKPNSTEEFQSISAADLEDPNLHLEVLQIYPDKGNNLKEWMEDNGYGKDLMTISEATMEEFNTDPSIIKNDDGTWKYDVIVIGCWDNNNRKDIQDNAKEVLSEYIESGRGIVFGHDTLCSTVNPNLRTLASYANIKVLDGDWNEYPNGGDETVSIQRVGLLTNYPWEIGEIGTLLEIPYSHNTGQFSNSDIWLKYENESSTYNGWNFYLTTYNNCAVINTGHSNGAATSDEQKIFANTIFYTYQLTEKNEHLDRSGQDIASPSLPYISVDTEERIVYLKSDDVGSEYTYYIKANLNDGTNVLSNEVTTTITSGIEGFYYILDNKPFTEITNTKLASYTEGAIDASLLEGNAYLHAYAVDKAGNKSSMVHINVDAIPEITSQPSNVTIHGNENKSVSFTVSASGDYVMYQWQQKVGDEWVDLINETRPTYKTSTVTNDMNGNTYRCMVYNDTSAIYSDEVSISIMNLSVSIPRDVNIDGTKKTASYEIKINGDTNGLNISVIPENQVQLKFGSATTYATFKYEALFGQATITTGVDGTWTGRTTFKLSFN